MNIKDTRKAGYERGYNVASWVNMPAIGETLSRSTDWQGIGTIESVEDQLDAWAMLCSEAESNDRCYSPFECTASALNEQPNSEALWEAYEEGITAGINGYRRKHHKLAALRKDLRQLHRD